MNKIFFFNIVFTVIWNMVDSSSCILESKNFSFGTDFYKLSHFYKNKHVALDELVGPVNKCELKCLSDSRCVGFSYMENIFCALYDRDGVISGIVKPGAGSFICDTDCTDRNGQLRKEGETWKEKCNTCTCQSRSVECTNIKDCDKDSDTSLDQLCTEGECMTPRCDSNCSLNQLCREGECTSHTCGNDSDCSTGQECRKGACISASFDNESKFSLNKECSGEFCKKPNGSDYLSKQTCRKGDCMSPACGNGNDCPPGQECRGEDFTIHTCRNDSYCPQGEACREGECITPCSYTLCYITHQCVVMNHQASCVKRFQQRCLNNFHCPADKECLRGQCIDPCSNVKCSYGSCKVVNHSAQCQL